MLMSTWPIENIDLAQIKKKTKKKQNKTMSKVVSLSKDDAYVCGGIVKA